MRMTRALIHRGPDDEGYFVGAGVGLGMRRLSIIDLTTGHQPIANEDESAWIVFNGEIYNFPALRKRLEHKGHTFRTRSDTEAIVHLYEDEGEGCPQSLNGMFAFAVWDVRRRSLLLARDRLGVKPLYYAALGDRLVFGSELKAVLEGGVSREIDYQAVHHYLSLGYIPAPWTIFRAVRKLEAGHVLVADDTGVQVRRYWDLPTEDERPVSADDPAFREELRALLTDAVRIRLLSDVPVGTFLSGGVDSSSIVALLARAGGGPHKTFSVGFEDAAWDERPWARAVARRFGTEHQELVVRMDVPAALAVLQRQFDEPFADASAVPTYLLSRMAREHVTVALGGDGGDEIFAGYYTYQADRLRGLYGLLPEWVRRGLPRAVEHLPVTRGKVGLDFKLRRFTYGGQFPPDEAHFAWKEWYGEAFKHGLYADAPSDLEPTVEVFRRRYARYRGRDALNRHLYVDTTISLPDDILVKVDRMSMATSLEVRGPFLDYRVAELMARVPGAAKMPGLRLKQVLKDVMRDDLPAEILTRRKQGFTPPVGAWLRTELREVVDEALSPCAIKRQGLFAPDVVGRLVAEHRRGERDWSRHLWILLMYSLWHERWA